MTFTNRLNYSVTEIPREEFLKVLLNYGKTKEDKTHAEEVQTQFLRIK
ncbi:MAG: hypothetical protein KUG78_14860 [Kangiellaceae bacterium]|nr:hypothetical protein [Kangiellaceae bacterium]